MSIDVRIVLQTTPTDWSTSHEVTAGACAIWTETEGDDCVVWLNFGASASDDYGSPATKRISAAFGGEVWWNDERMPWLETTSEPPGGALAPVLAELKAELDALLEQARAASAARANRIDAMREAIADGSAEATEFEGTDWSDVWEDETEDQ